MLKYKMERIMSFFSRSTVTKLITSEEVSEKLTRETVRGWFGSCQCPCPRAQMTDNAAELSLKQITFMRSATG
jgi:hypothetical protein